MSWSRTALWLAAVLLASCGFSVRGALTLPASMDRTYLQASDRYSDLVRNLERGLRASGVDVVGQRSEASAVLRIIDDSAGERVLSVSARGEPQEFELFHTVRYELLSDTGVLLEPQTVTLTRDYFFDEEDILGKSEDAALLRTALAEDVARAILRRVALAARR